MGIDGYSVFRPIASGVSSIVYTFRPSFDSDDTVLITTRCSLPFL